MSDAAVTTTLRWRPRATKKLRAAALAFARDHFEGAEDDGAALVIRHGEKDLRPIHLFLGGSRAYFRDIKAREGQENDDGL